MSLMIDSKTLGVEATEQAASRLPVEQPPPRPVRTRRGRVGSMVKVSMITGVGCVGALFAAEHLGPPEWKPSTMIGAFGGKEQTAQILASLEAARAMTAMQEEEKARALQEVEVLRANQDRLTRAYQAEFDRGTELIRAGAAAAQEVLRASTMAKMKALSGKASTANQADVFAGLCTLGAALFQTPDCSRDASNYAAVQRSEIQTEIIEGWKQAQGQINQIARSWADGLPDPLDLIAKAQAQGQAFTPKPRAPVPPRPDLGPVPGH